MRSGSQLLSIGLLLATLASPLTAQDDRPGWIGISLNIPVAGAGPLSDAALVISDVRRGSPADRAGVRSGDKLLAIEDLRGPMELSQLPQRLRISPGDRVNMTIQRGAEQLDVVVTATERPLELRATGPALAMEPDSLVETMVRAMDSLRLQIVQLRRDRSEGVGPAPMPDTHLRIEERSGAVGAPFEFFVFRGEVYDSLWRAMEELNRAGENLRRREQVRMAELRAVARASADSGAEDGQLRDLRAALERVQRQSAQLRSAMSEAARATAAIDYLARGRPAPDAAQPDGTTEEPFRPLTPYLVGSNMVAGAQVVELRPGLARYFQVDAGVLIVDVAPGTPAALAGLVPGDVVTRLGQAVVHSVEDLRVEVSRSSESVPVTLVRDGTPLEVLLRRR